MEIPATAHTGPWQFGIGPSAIFGADAKFSGLGSWRSPNPVRPPTGTVNREYDDGFNRVDATENADNMTSYWGYQRASQYDPSGSGSISMSIFDGGPNGSASDEATGWGGEIFASREVGPVNIPNIVGATWGWRLGFSIHKFSFEDNSTVATRLNALTDTYGLGGAVPPGAPFSGSPLGFGNAILADQPIRTFSSGNSATSGSRDLDAVLFGFSAGPYLELPLTERFAVRLDAGATLAVMHGDYKYSSTTTITGVGAQATRGSETDDDLLPGLFAGISAVFAATPQVSLIGSVRYQYLDDFEVEARNSRAKIEFSGACLVSVGAIFKF